MKRLTRAVIVAALLLSSASAFAQDTRVIGRKSARQISFAASLSAFSTTFAEPIISPSGQVTFEESSRFFGFYYGSWDVGYFTTDHLVFNIGNSFNGMINAPAGLKPTIDLSGGALYYFAPGGTTSPYVGGKYLIAISNRADGDAGNVLGTVGLQTLVSDRSSIFGEIGYGGAVKELDSGAIQLSVGVRVRF